MRWLWGAVLVATAALAGCTPRVEPPTPGTGTADPARPEFYTGRVRPIFVRQCAHCHLGMSHKGDLALSSKAAILKGGKHGAIIVPGNPDASLLVKAIRQEPGVKPMPEDSRLADADIDTISRWIQAGAIMPDPQ